MHIIFLLIEVLASFERELYVVNEGNGSLQVCVTIEGRLEGTSVTVIAATQSNVSAQGK